MNRFTLATAFLAALTTAVLAQDFEEGLKAAKSGDYATAVQEWEQLAEQGNVTAQYYLGKMYRRGLGGVQDNEKAVKWYVEAAEQGLAAAQNDLGSIHKNGLIVAQDYAEAIKWYRKAADQGSWDARYKLDYILSVALDDAGAVKCGNLCDKLWWMSGKTVADLQAELDAGAKVDAENEGKRTPLHYSAFCGAPENVKLLLDAGAQVDARTTDGVTPLIFAAMFGNAESIQLLLNSGADAKAMDAKDKTPWDYAQHNLKLKRTDAFWALYDALYK